MGIKLFLNDYYDLLKFMHDNEVVILDEKSDSINTAGDSDNFKM